MKKILKTALLIGLVYNPISCKKYVQQQEQNALMQLVTNGTWRVTGYMDHGIINRTDTFSGFIFQFNSNGIVSGSRNGIQTNGTWYSDISTRTITSNFPSSGGPLNLLNYVWKITDSYPDSVAAKTAVGAQFNILNLHKN
jgi:hypothetical protein